MKNPKLWEVINQVITSEGILQTGVIPNVAVMDVANNLLTRMDDAQSLDLLVSDVLSSHGQFPDTQQLCIVFLAKVLGEYARVMEGPDAANSLGEAIEAYEQRAGAI